MADDVAIEAEEAGAREVVHVMLGSALVFIAFWLLEAEERTLSRSRSPVYVTSWWTSLRARVRRPRS